MPRKTDRDQIIECQYTKLTALQKEHMTKKATTARSKPKFDWGSLSEHQKAIHDGPTFVSEEVERAYRTNFANAVSHCMSIVLDPAQKPKASTIRKISDRVYKAREKVHRDAVERTVDHRYVYRADHPTETAANRGLRQGYAIFLHFFETKADPKAVESALLEWTKSTLEWSRDDCSKLTYNRDWDFVDSQQQSALAGAAS